MGTVVSFPSYRILREPPKEQLAFDTVVVRVFTSLGRPAEEKTYRVQVKEPSSDSFVEVQKEVAFSEAAMNITARYKEALQEGLKWELLDYTGGRFHEVVPTTLRLTHSR